MMGLIASSRRGSRQQFGEYHRSEKSGEIHESIWELVWVLTWDVTAVHGRAPMNVPRKQSVIETPQTPHAMLRPDQGTTPIRRRIDSRIHTGVLFCEVEFESESPCRAFLVTARARGNH